MLEGYERLRPAATGRLGEWETAVNNNLKAEYQRLIKSAVERGVIQQKAVDWLENGSA